MEEKNKKNNKKKECRREIATKNKELKQIKKKQKRTKSTRKKCGQGLSN